MEMKSISDCLNFIDSMILCSVEKHVGMGNLEDLRNYMIGMYKDKYIAEMLATLAILYQISLITERFHLDNEIDFRKQFCEMRKRMWDFLDECNTKPEVDYQQ